jgi:hypothetical protein
VARPVPLAVILAGAAAFVLLGGCFVMLVGLFAIAALARGGGGGVDGPAPTPGVLDPNQPTQPGTPRDRIPGMVPYQDPLGKFAINYPQNWKVEEATLLDTTTRFYEDDPKGTVYFVVYQGAIFRTMNGEGFLQYLLEQARQDYPDIRITRKSTQPMIGSGRGPEITETARASFAWTKQGVPYQAETQWLMMSSGMSGATTYGGQGYQGPTAQWPRLQPIFRTMEQSYRFFGPARPPDLPTRAPEPTRPG